MNALLLAALTGLRDATDATRLCVEHELQSEAERLRRIDELVADVERAVAALTRAIRVSP
jgi:serine/threonine protein phosphatase PrpC